MVKFWITTHALTTGVVTVKGELSEAPGSGVKYARYVGPDGDTTSKRIGTEAFKTRREAMDRVHEMATREIQAIDRKRTKLERLIIGLEGAVPA